MAQSHNSKNRTATSLWLGTMGTMGGFTAFCCKSLWSACSSKCKLNWLYCGCIASVTFECLCVFVVASPSCSVRRVHVTGNVEFVFQIYAVLDERWTKFMWTSVMAADLLWSQWIETSSTNCRLTADWLAAVPSLSRGTKVARGHRSHPQTFQSPPHRVTVTLVVLQPPDCSNKPTGCSV